MDILEYTFFQNAVVGILLAGVACALVGTYVVARRLVFIGGGITHASFGGIGIGVYFGLTPVLSAMAFSVLSAFGIQWMSRRGGVREDSAIAMFWTLGMSIGILCSFLTPGFSSDLPSFLFGSILTISAADLWLLAAVTMVVLVVFALFYRQILAVAFDPVFARSRHLPVDFIECLMLALTAVTIVSTLRIAGVVLALSLLTVPQMTACLFSFSFKRIAAWSIVIGWVDSFLGLAMSYCLNVPSGASIIFTSVLIYFAAKAIKTIVTELNKREIA